jgi:hypothetical protein
LLSANWFPSWERARATSISVNANALGIALVYTFAPLIVRSDEDIPRWEFTIALLSTIVWVVACFSFVSRSPDKNLAQIPAASLLGQNSVENLLGQSPGANQLGENPSQSQMLGSPSLHVSEGYDWNQWVDAFHHAGFWMTVMSFAISECILNCIASLLNKFLIPVGYSKVS